MKLATQSAGKFRCWIKNDLRLDKLRLVGSADCTFGGKRCGGGLLTMCDSFLRGTFHALSWSYRVIRRVVRSSLGGEALSFLETSELLPDVERFFLERLW